MVDAVGRVEENDEAAGAVVSEITGLTGGVGMGASIDTGGIGDTDCAGTSSNNDRKSSCLDWLFSVLVIVDDDLES